MVHFDAITSGIKALEMSSTLLYLTLIIHFIIARVLVEGVEFGLMQVEDRLRMMRKEPHHLQLGFTGDGKHLRKTIFHIT